MKDETEKEIWPKKEVLLSHRTASSHNPENSSKDWLSNLLSAPGQVANRQATGRIWCLSCSVGRSCRILTYKAISTCADGGGWRGKVLPALHGAGRCKTWIATEWRAIPTWNDNTYK